VLYIAPIGAPNSSERRSLDGLMATVLEPTLEKFGLVPVVAHLLSDSGSITQQIIQHLLKDDLVIALLSGLNPNVMYELAVRHAAGKPLICLVENPATLPFDIKDERTIFFDGDFLGASTLLQQLPEFITSALEPIREPRQCVAR
jgi:hypothetical protein